MARYSAKINPNWRIPKKLNRSRQLNKKVLCDLQVLYTSLNAPNPIFFSGKCVKFISSEYLAMVLKVNDGHHGAGLPTPVGGNTADSALVPQLGGGDQEGLTVLLIDNRLVSLVLTDRAASLVPDNAWARPPRHHTGKTDLANTTSDM